MPEYLRIVLDIAILLAVIVFFIALLIQNRKCVKKISAGVGSAKIELDMSGMDEQTREVFTTVWRRFDELKDSLGESKRQYKEIATQNAKDLREIKDTIETVINKVDGIFVDHLKMMFYSENLDNEEKMCAGLKYIYAGHNHSMKQDVIQFAIAHKVIYRSLVLAKPEWRVSAIDIGIGEQHGLY